jgi:hypothetical protein
MYLSEVLRNTFRFSMILAAALSLGAQEPAAPGNEARKEAQALPQGLPPRVAPTDYQAQAKAGTVTIAAEFTGHSVPTARGVLTTEDFVMVETGLYGPADARLQISLDDFSLRINGKKTPLRSEPFGLTLTSLKDPEWSPPDPAASKSKGGLSTGGQGESSSPPPVVKIPVEVQRSMGLRTQKAALPLGDRPLPQAGLLFFRYRGKVQKIASLELLYEGPAGKATLKLHP